MFTNVRGLVLFFIVLAFILGCGKKVEEKALEKMIEKEIGGKAKVDLSDESVNIKTKDGEMTMTTGKSAKVPDDFPSDVYIYKPATIEMAMKIPQGHSLSLVTKNDISKVTETYKKKMTGKGWSEKATMDIGPQTMLVYEKGELITNVGIMPDNSSTRINVTVSKK